jgi:hypothetical protein
MLKDRKQSENVSNLISILLNQWKPEVVSLKDRKGFRRKWMTWEFLTEAKGSFFGSFIHSDRWTENSLWSINSKCTWICRTFWGEGLLPKVVKTFSFLFVLSKLNSRHGHLKRASLIMHFSLKRHSFLVVISVSVFKRINGFLFFFRLRIRVIDHF